ncbi:sensor histidine kinase [Roseovarius salinarum]|uniref:sensor histidine kinase n=1 Tax=Roseovarius salinarum TaxID=1981892 RepID=UPI001E65541E|nr:ATP-binding protein [Roseovarius salinarum]
MILLFVLTVAVCAGAIWQYGRIRALDQLEKQGRADLALAADRFTGQLRRYRELAVLMAENPALTALPAPGAAARARKVLQEAADKTGAMGLAYADTRGQILAQAGTGPRGPAGTPHFERAMQGALGASAGVLEAAGGARVFAYAAPAFGADGKVTGALVVLVDIAELEWDWIGGRPAVFFTDGAGRVFLSNRSELLFWQRDAGAGLAPPEGPAPRFSARRVGPHEVWTMDWGDYLPARALHLERPLPVIGMTGHALMDVGPARWVAGLQASVFALTCLVFGALLFVATERRRTLARANAQLESRVAERTAELSGANRRLRREVAEREEAEAALKKAQDDLVRAGKLSALGQISAGISHELNQPLMAIRQFADNAAQFLSRGRTEVAEENLGRISQMAARMARIISNLRAFARQESEPVTRVDIVSVIDQALELTEPRLRREGVSVDWARPDHPVHVQGGEVRLGQVLINLITNAADAMAESAEKRIAIGVEAGPPVVVEMRDTGPGIEAPEKIFDPFYSTKPVSSDEGMGLGLSISYGLVQSFGGEILGHNADDGGAVFRLELEPWPQEAVA